MVYSDQEDFVAILRGISPSEEESGMSEELGRRIATALFERAQQQTENRGASRNVRFRDYFENAGSFFSQLASDPSLLVAEASGSRVAYPPEYPRHMGVLCRNMAAHFEISAREERAFDRDAAINWGSHERFGREIAPMMRHSLTLGRPTR